MWWQPVVVFLVITVLYFSFYDQIEHYPGFFVITALSQYAINMGISPCKFNTRNAIAVLCMTLLPWLFIFGVMLMCIHHIAPNIKYLFANVYGYWQVASAADKLIKSATNGTTDLAHKIYANPSRFINYITVENFEETYEDFKKETTRDIKDELLKLVKSRETIGIAAWYIHTGILAICLVQTYMSSYVCK